MYPLLCSCAVWSGIHTRVIGQTRRLLSDKGQEVDHGRPWDDTKLQLKQPTLG